MQGHKRLKAMVVGSILILGNELLLLYNYLIFSFLLSSNKAKRGVQFSHSTRNSSTIRRKVKTECHSTSFPLSTLLYAGCRVKLKIYVYLFFINTLCKVISAALSSVTQHAMSWEFVGNYRNLTILRVREWS